ncbi:MAG: 3-isopropylmalate dehydratase small subunit [Candidatus Omnitrophica bacterium]|nr:3-isopropylmalate dehydratase small subunit [Candidatus Omnitrophota bacterium]
MTLTGKSHKFGDDINTDYIISGRYKFKTLDMKELAQHIFEDIVPDFYSKLSPGDFIVAGNNFGCGSSREQAVLALKNAQISAIIAKSFARIFYRNGINVGLILLETDTDSISEEDILKIYLKKGIIINETKNISLPIKPIPEFFLDIIQEGGVINYLKKYGDFKV